MSSWIRLALITLATRSELLLRGRNRRRADENQEGNGGVSAASGTSDPAGLTQTPQTDSLRVNVGELTKGGNRGTDIPARSCTWPCSSPVDFPTPRLS